MAIALVIKKLGLRDKLKKEINENEAHSSEKISEEQVLPPSLTANVTDNDDDNDVLEELFNSPDIPAAETEAPILEN